MEGTLNVTPDKLIGTAQQLESNGNTIRNMTQEFTDIATGLTSVWKGDAAKQYLDKFSRLQNDVELMARMIQEHVKDLNEMARVYQETEANNVSVSAGLASDVIK